MTRILVLAEHRMGELRDVSFELIGFARQIKGLENPEVSCLILGSDIKDYAEKLAEYADKIITVQDKSLEGFNSEYYVKALKQVMEREKPFLTLIGHTAVGMELAPWMASSLGVPLATDCIDVKLEDGKLKVTRQIYSGKINMEATLKEAESYILTIRPGTFPAEEVEPVTGTVEEFKVELGEPKGKKFLKYVEPPKGEVDIEKAEVIVAIGRPVREPEQIAIFEELANALGGVLACSRPVADKGLLPKDRQVGSSGKTVKPKLYIAMGISGAFQHILGMKNAKLIIAVNKDPKAPIFNVAHYGIVQDMYKIAPVLKEEIQKLKQQA